MKLAGFADKNTISCFKRSGRAAGYDFDDHDPQGPEEITAFRPFGA